MGLALGRLAAAMAKGRAGYHTNRARQQQQSFENERQLASEADQRAYREALAENQRAQVESVNQQRMAAQMAAQRAEAEKAQARSRRISALGRKGIYEPALADDDVAFRQAMAPPAPTPQRNIDPLSPEGIAARKQLAGYEASLRPQGPKPKPVSEAKGSELAVTQGLLKMGSDLREEFGGFVGQGKDLTGPIRGGIGATVRTIFRREPSEFINARGRLANLGSELMKARSGGAITPQEFERLAPFIPGAKDDEVEIQDKLAGFVQALAAIQQEKLEGLEDIGRDVGALKTRYDPEIGSVLGRSRVPSVREKGQRQAPLATAGDTAIPDPKAQQRADYDAAAAVLTRQGKNPLQVLGRRP